MTLPTEGRYQFRYFPVPEDDLAPGVAATVFEGLNKPIGTASTDIHALFHQQIWKIKSLGESNFHILYAPSKAPEEVASKLGQIGFHHDVQVGPGTSITLEYLSEYHVRPAGAPDVYIIHPVGDFGPLLNLAVGISKNGTLGIKEIKGDLQIPEYSRPAWRFEPVMGPGE